MLNANSNTNAYVKKNTKVKCKVQKPNAYVSFNCKTKPGLNMHGEPNTSPTRLVKNRFSFIRNQGDHTYNDGLMLWFATHNP